MDQQTIQELSSTGRHQECLQACQQLLQGDPDSTAAWKYAGKSLLALGQLEKAQQCLTKAHQLDTKDPEITKDIGNIFLNLGNKDAAAQWYEKSLGINNNYAPAINNLANLKRQGGNNQEAVDLFRRAIQADPQLIQAYSGAAASLLALSDLDQAEAFATQAIEINAHAPGINEILGIIFQNKKNLRQAVESYQKELDINPQSNTSLLNLGVLLLQQGEAAAAIEPLARAAAINPSEQCSLLLAQAYQNIGQFKEAAAEYKKLDPNKLQDKKIPFNLGLCLLNTGNNNDAIEAFKIAVQLDNTFVGAWGNMGTAFMNKGRHQEALRALEKVLELDPDNPTAHTNLGTIYKNFGNLDQALTSTLKSLELKPDNPDALINLGSIYQDLGNLDQALTSTLKSLELQPDQPTAHMNLGGIYKGLGNLDQALASTLKSLELKPDNPNALINLGSIYQDLGNLDQALTSTLKSLELQPDNPDVHMNLGGIYKDLGNLDQALASTLKALELKPDDPDIHMNLGTIYNNLGNLDQALASTLKSLELKPDNPDTLINLSGIYKDLGNLDKALASTRKSLELKPEDSNALCKLGLIKMALGQTKEARKSLLSSIDQNNQMCEAYHALSTMLETTEEAEEVIKLMKSVKTPIPTPLARAFAEFTLSNCFHKIKNHDLASKHLQLANKYKSMAFTSNADAVLQKIALSASNYEHADTTNVNPNSGKGRIFIVGMPRSGSTLLETVLSMNPEIKDLGETRSLAKAIAKMQQQEASNSDHQNLDELYSKIQRINADRYKYTTDKQLYNFIHIHWISNHMPAAKIIHCRRNPMDNILSMHKSNLMAGNNFTASLEDSAKVLIAQEQAIQIHKKKHPAKIYTFDYDQFVNAPEVNLRRLLEWLDLEFDYNYLRPEKSTRNVSTASVMQARKPITNKSVGSWKNYKNLLKPALRILEANGILIE